MSQLPATLSPSRTAEEKCSQGITPTVPWGLLIPQRLGMQKVELYEEHFTFGRALDCTLRAEEKFITRGRIKCISTLHLIITNKSNKIPVIRDVSRNGTWVNGNFVGKDKEVVLQDGDEISVGMKNYKIFLFKHLNQKTPLLDEIYKKFVILETLGKGAFGKVNLAFTKIGCRPRAIKELVKVNAASDVNNPLKIENEIKILSSLSHPNIVKMMDFFENDRAFFIVLEYMNGGTLQDRIQREECMSEMEVKLIFYQIIRAVKYLHENEITHRDLKPANVLLSSDNMETVAKVSDFGLSKITENDTFLITACGTPHFVAPEIWVYPVKGKSYTKKVDIWSTGVILYYMFSKKLPFATKSHSDNIQKLCKLIICGRYSTTENLWKSISNDAKSVLKMMLTANPNYRASAQEIKQHPWINNDNEMKMKVEALISKCDEDLDSTEQPLKKMRFI